MVLYGFVNLYKTTKKKKYLEYSKKMADFLIDTMQNTDGSFIAIYNEKSGVVKNSIKKWSTQPGSFHTKNAMGLSDLFEITKDKKYKESALKICQFALTKQETTGRFITDSSSKTTHLHPHCYTCEGLYYVGNMFNIKVFKQSAEKGTDWALSNSNKNGINEIFYPDITSFSDFQRSDIIAQVIRIGLLHAKDNEKIEALVKVLLSYKTTQNKKNSAFYFSKKHKHINFWCTIFSFQALFLYYNKELIQEKENKLNLLI